MKKTINNSNKYFSTAKKKEKMIINAVYSSIKVENSKTTKEELKEHYKSILTATTSSSITRRT